MGTGYRPLHQSYQRYEAPETGLDLADNHGGAFMKSIRYLGVWRCCSCWDARIHPQ